jgi:hypothetical protein
VHVVLRRRGPAPRFLPPISVVLAGAMSRYIAELLLATLLIVSCGLRSERCERPRRVLAHERLGIVEGRGERVDARQKPARRKLRHLQRLGELHVVRTHVLGGVSI